MGTVHERLGIPHVDRVLAAIPANSSLVLVNDPGVVAEPFLYQSAHSHLQAGLPVVYAVFSRPPSAVLRAMHEYGFDPGNDLAQLKFLDGFSPLMGGYEDAAYTLDDPGNLQQLADLLARASKENPDAVLVIDSLSTLVDHASIAAFRTHLPALHEAMKRFRLSVSLFTKWPYGDDLGAMLAPFDGMVRLKGVEDRILLSQYFLVERTGWPAPQQPRPLAYKALRPGGVFFYVPKVVVTGAYHAGKTTFVHSLSDAAVSVNRLGTTVALDHGHVTLDGFSVDLFGTPGQERFDPLLKTISSQALGVIVVVDSTRPESFGRTKDMMQQTWRQGIPIIVAANKQDLPDALPPQEVARLLGCPSHVRVIGCTGTSQDSSRGVLKALLDQLLLGASAP